MATLKTIGIVVGDQLYIAHLCLRRLADWWEIALESVGIPIPGETVLLAAAVYAGTTHDLNIVSVIAAGIVGAIVGNLVAFSIGRVCGYRLLRRYGGYLHLNDSRIKIGQYLFLRHGGKVVLIARFVPVLRSVAGLLAGANCMPWSSFMIANVCYCWFSADWIMG